MNWYSFSGTFDISGVVNPFTIELKQQRTFRIEFFLLQCYDVATGGSWKTAFFLVAGDAAANFKPISDQSIGGVGITPDPHMFVTSNETVYPYVTIPAVPQLQIIWAGIAAPFATTNFFFLCTMGVNPLS